MASSNASMQRPKADPVDPTHQTLTRAHRAGLQSSPRPAETVDTGPRPIPRAEPADTYMVDSGGDVVPNAHPDAAHHPVTDQPKKGRAALFGFIGLGVLALIAIIVFAG